MPPAPPLAVEAASITRRFCFALLQRSAAVALRTRVILVSRALNSVGALKLVHDERAHAQQRSEATCDGNEDSVPPVVERDGEAGAPKASADNGEIPKISSDDRSVGGKAQAEMDFNLDASVLEAGLVAMLDGEDVYSAASQGQLPANDEPTPSDNAESEIERDFEERTKK